MSATQRLIRNEKSPSFTVHVTQRHIDEAKRCLGHKCMITEAIIDARPGVEYVRTDIGDIRFSDPKTNRKYKYFIPKKAASALVAWDRGDDVKPFSFKIQDAQIRERGWKGQRAATAKRKHYVRTGLKRQHYAAPRERQFGMCYFTPAEDLR